MPTNVRTASFGDPTTLIAPDLAVQQQQLQRRQALIDALREQSMQQDQVPTGSTMSWTQGLGKLGEALAARISQKKVDAKNLELAGAMRDRLGPMFGVPGQPAPSTAAANMPMDTRSDMPVQPPMPTGINLPATGQNINLPSASPSPSAPPSASPQGGGAVPMPGAQQMPQQPATRGPWSLSGNPQQDMADYFLNPDKYGEAVIGSHSPVDMAKTVQQARDAMARGDVATASALLANIQKQNYIEPVNVRPGGTVNDPNNPSHVLFQSVSAPPGHMTNYGPDGRATNIAPVVGGLAALRDAKSAESFGGAAGNLSQTYDPATDTYRNIPTQTALTTPGGVITGQGPGAKKGAETDADMGVHAFASDASAAANTNIIRQQINNIRTLSQVTPTGQGAEGLAKFKSHVNTLMTGSGLHPWFDVRGIANIEMIQKDASALAQQQAQALGGAAGSTDAKLAAAFQSLPDANKQPETIQAITRILGARQDMVDARKNAEGPWVQAHGQTQSAWNEFNRQFTNAADADLFERLATWGGNPAVLRQGLSAPQAAQMLMKYRALKQMGAIR